MSKLTIIMPVYNAADTLQAAIDSVTAQSYTDISIIIVDDASTDTSLQMMQAAAAGDAGRKMPAMDSHGDAMAAKKSGKKGVSVNSPGGVALEKDSRIKVLTMKSHSGAAAARNAALQAVEADCPYVYFADADDVMAVNAAQVMVDKMESTGADLLTFGYRQMSRKNSSVKEITAPAGSFTGAQIRADYTTYTAQSPCKVLGSCWNKCFRMDIIRRYGVEFGDMPRNEEEVFILRYLEHTETVYNIPDILYDFYPIDLQRAWERLPEDFCEYVELFRKIRLEYAQKWGCDTPKTREFIAGEYWGKMMLGLRLCFNPKKKQDGAEFNRRVKMIMQGLKDIGHVPTSVAGSSIYKLMKVGLTPAVKMMIKRNC